MTPAVYPNFVTIVGNVSRQAWRLRYLGTEQEESRAHAPFAEQLQEQRSRFKVGTVVECQRHVIGERLARQERKQRRADRAQRGDPRTRVRYGEPAGCRKRAAGQGPAWLVRHGLSSTLMDTDYKVAQGISNWAPADVGIRRLIHYCNHVMSRICEVSKRGLMSEAAGYRGFEGRGKQWEVKLRAESFTNRTQPR